MPTEPLPLHHSWPLCDLAQRFDLGWLHDDDAASAPDAAPIQGYWAYDLVEARLHWSPAVFALFGFDRDTMPSRPAAVACYAESSRAAMERLRAHAIRHRRGFTLDIAIRPVRGVGRWLRLTAAPVCAGNAVVRLHGGKTDVSHLYPPMRR